MKLLGNRERGLLFVISAPSGTGKTTLAEKVLAEFPDALARSISCTTRAPRGAEKDGVDYFFLTPEEFAEKEEDDAFLESVDLFSAKYGTLASHVEEVRCQGKHVLLVIDTQGGLAVRMKTDAVLIFVAPPSLDALRERLEGRETESEEAIEERLSIAEKEMERSAEYDYLIINDELDIACEVLKSILVAEEHANH